MAGETNRNKKKLFSITSIGLIVLVIIVVANIVVWKDHLGERAQIDVLNNEISHVHQRIGETPQPPQNLEVKLETVKAELAAVQNVFPGTVNRNDVIDYIIDVAEECQVQVVPLISQGWVTENAGQSYRVLKLSGTVTGSLEQATNFISKLQGSKYPTMTITELTVQRLDGLDISNLEDNIQVAVNMNIALYAYSPVANEDTV